MIPKHFLLIFFFLIFYVSAFSQQQESNSIYLKNGISKHNILSVHPFGIFFNRLQGNFKTHASKQPVIQLSLESANVWSQPLIVYAPNSESVRNDVRQVEWFVTEFNFDIDEIAQDAQRIDVSIDGVYKSFRGNFAFAINPQHELNFGVRAFLLTDGKFPFSFFTGDEFIEWFHSNIAGGEDPFGRRANGLNQAQITYNDRNGNRLTIDNNEAFIGGFETSYYYYPKHLFEKLNNVSINFGAHLGINTYKQNASLDLGITANGLKRYDISPSKYVQIGFNLGVLRKGITYFNSNRIELNTNDFIGNLETAVEYSFISKKNTTHSFGIDFYLQTSLNKKDELNELVFVRNGAANGAFGTGFENLFRNNNYWTFLYSFTKKVTTTFYIQQDLTVTNNPDIQTGVSISFGL